MKTNTYSRLFVAGGFAVLSTFANIVFAAGPAGGYSAHEWGTFTSVQGGDGKLLSWRPLESSVLPKFVYDWRNPGMERRSPEQNLLTKVSMVTLQRMETPVIYFYADEPQTVDVSVKFPKGRITEWYPQAAQVGPAFTARDDLKCFALSESGAHWAKVGIVPQKQKLATAASLPFDRSGSHYFAARETDAAVLNVESPDVNKPKLEQEKFLFYRGTGNFSTPLKVTTGPDDSVTVANTGREPLVHLFILGLQNQVGNFIYIDKLAPGAQRTVQMDITRNHDTLHSISTRLATKMATALVSQGLYTREATAMVNTWKDSWFTEDGLRVLYVLPRAWTDQTLPLTLTPAPKEVVRVMVGRAEVITPAMQHQLLVSIQKAGRGDNLAGSQAMAEFKARGRFAEPALQLALTGTDQKTSQLGWQLYQSAMTPVPAKVIVESKLAASSPYE